MQRLLPSLFFGLAFLVVTSMTGGAAEPSPKSPSVTGQWLAEQDTQWQATFQRDVQEAHDKAVAELKKQYLAAVETLFLTATRGARLDDAVALRAERDRLSGGGGVPVGEEVNAPAVLKTMRAGFAKSHAALLNDRAARAKALHGRYDALLAQSQTALTQRQRFDEALEIKARREQLNAAWLETTAVVVPTPVPAASTKAAATPAPPTSSLPIVATVRPAERMDLFISGSNGITLYINNKEAITGVNRDSASKVRVGLREGDVIAVKNADRWDINSFWLSCISSNGQFLFESSEKWTSYIPASEGKWWIIKNAKEQKPAEPAPDRQEYVDQVKKAMKDTPLNHGAQPIRSVLNIEGSRATYLYYTVSRADLLPKPDPKVGTK